MTVNLNHGQEPVDPDYETTFNQIWVQFHTCLLGDNRYRTERSILPLLMCTQFRLDDLFSPTFVGMTGWRTECPRIPNSYG